MCLRNVSSRGNSSSGGNSSSFNVSSKCVFASSFTYPPWQKCVFEMCLRLRAEKCVHQCAHNGNVNTVYNQYTYRHIQWLQYAARLWKIRSVPELAILSFCKDIAMTMLGQESSCWSGEKRVPETHRNRNLRSWRSKRKVVFQPSIL